jgi:hypothetical protein
MHDDKDWAQAKLKECGVKPGQIYRHYKRGLCVVVAVSLKEDGLEPMVTYHCNVKGSTWTRTLENFTEGVEFRGVTHSRFARVQE